jgi:hypothetical protein
LTIEPNFTLGNWGGAASGDKVCAVVFFLELTLAVDLMVFSVV